MCADWGYSTENGNVFAIIQTWHDPRMLCALTLPELESSRNFRTPDILLSGAFQWIIVKWNCFYGLRFVDKVDADCSTRETIVSGNDNEQPSVSKQVNKLQRK